MSFPDTRYMGSKRAILPFIMKHLSQLEFNTALDAFSGSACVAYRIKRLGKRVIANDFHKFAFHIAKTTIENNGTRLSQADLESLLVPHARAGSFVREIFTDLYFDEEDCEFIDNTYANIAELKSSLRKSMALAALCRACVKKRPRGIFTFVRKTGRDGRRDLRLTLRQHFIDAASLFNQAVFSNKRRNRALCLDVFDTPAKGVDLVYIDPPYMSPHSDSDYTRRYHFLEGLCTYWKGLTIQEHTITKKIPSYPTAFKSPSGAHDALMRLFEHFKESILVVSYGSNGSPDRGEMIKMLRQFKRRVWVKETKHKYSFGNHKHRIGRNNNDVREYLFLGS